MPVAILLEGEPESGGSLFQGARQCGRICRGHRATVPVDRNQRPLIARVKQPLFDGRFKLIVVRDDQPSGIPRSLDKCFRDWLIRRPDPDRPINRVADAQYCRCRIAGVTPGAGELELEVRAGFDISEEGGHSDDRFPTPPAPDQAASSSDHRAFAKSGKASFNSSWIDAGFTGLPTFVFFCFPGAGAALAADSVGSAATTAAAGSGWCSI